MSAFRLYEPHSLEEGDAVVDVDDELVRGEVEREFLGEIPRLGPAARRARRPAQAAEEGGKEVSLPVLASTLTTIVVFYPVTTLYGVSKYLFTALALAVVLALFASYVVAMTVVPLFCATFIRIDPGNEHHTASAKEGGLAASADTSKKHRVFRTVIRKFNME